MHNVYAVINVHLYSAWFDHLFDIPEINQVVRPDKDGIASSRVGETKQWHHQGQHGAESRQYDLLEENISQLLLRSRYHSPGSPESPLVLQPAGLYTCWQGS